MQSQATVHRHKQWRLMVLVKFSNVRNIVTLHGPFGGELIFEKFHRRCAGTYCEFKVDKGPDKEK